MRTDRGMLHILLRFRRYGRPHRRALAGGVACRVAELVADLAAPWPIAIVIDGVLGHRPKHGLPGALLAYPTLAPTSLLTLAAVASLVFVAASSTFDYLGDRLMNSAGERITAAVRADVFDHLLQLPMRFHDERAVGELTSRLSADTDRIEDGLIDVFSTLLPGALTVGGLAATMLALDWRLGLIAIGSAPIAFVAAARYSTLTRQAARNRRAAEGQLSSLTAETLTGIRTVHAAGGHGHHQRQFATANDVALQAGLRAVELRARLTPLVELSAAAGTAGLLWAGGYGALRGWWTPGLLIVTLAYMRDLLKPIRSLSRLSLTLTTGAASAERVTEILDHPTPSTRGLRPNLFDPSVELRNVSVNYGRGLVLNDFDLRVRAGERVALLGANGAGKSSVLAVIARLYEPQSGQARLGGYALQALDLAWLRTNIAVILQDTFLFSGTLAENICYAERTVSHAQLLAACAAAGVLDFVPDLPDGLETLLGDRGIGLSGGQRQRVGIARALLKDAPILLMDEPTSGLDTDTEANLVDVLRRLMSGRTVIMTTHRPALLRLADRRVTLVHGTTDAQDAEAAPVEEAAQQAIDRPRVRAG